MYKQIKNYENYLIDENGNVLNTKTKKILNGSIGEHGYKYYRLSKNGCKKMFYAHRLVAETFLLNIDNLPVVNHKDGNKLNNNINNLEWVSYSNNMKHYHLLKKRQNNKTEKYVNDLPEEQWVDVINNENYLVSSLGRIRNKKTNNLLHPSDTCGYYKVRLSNNGKVTDWLIHKLVYQSFNNLKEIPNNYCINHIDGNKHNNKLNNLELISLSENVNQAYYKQKINSNIKPINQFSLNGELLNSFPSGREASRILKIDSSSIIKCCRGKLKTTGGFIFKYA